MQRCLLGAANFIMLAVRVIKSLNILYEYKEIPFINDDGYRSDFGIM